MYAKDLSEPKYAFLIEKSEDGGPKHLNDPEEFIECYNKMDDVYEDIYEYNSSRERKILLAFDAMISDIITNKKFKT